MALRALRGVAIAALVIAYSFLAHYSNAAGRPPWLGAIVSILPPTLIGLTLAWNASRRGLALGFFALACFALGIAWPLLEHHFDLVYWLQNIGLYLILFFTFARTLRAGRQPLCTRFSEALYGPSTPVHARYTRQVTVAWTLFFAAMMAVSTLLFCFAPIAAWSFFSNFLTLPLVALMFLVEYGVRRRVLPDTGHMRFFDAIRAYREDAKRPH